MYILEAVNDSLIEGMAQVAARKMGGGVWETMKPGAAKWAAGGRTAKRYAQEIAKKRTRPMNPYKKSW